MILAHAGQWWNSGGMSQTRTDQVMLLLGERVERRRSAASGSSEGSWVFNPAALRSAHPDLHPGIDLDSKRKFRLRLPLRWRSSTDGGGHDAVRRVLIMVEGRCAMVLRRVLVIVLSFLVVGLWFAGGIAYAQPVPTGVQLEQLVAPFALFPDALVAQICAASTDPQQIHDVDLWMRRNSHLEGQALTDAAQQQGFDPAFISLVNFPTVLDMMAANLDDYAALGEAFKADQQAVMAAIQTLRQDAYARGVLDSNEYQTVAVEQQNNVQVVVIQPANPQVVFVPVYQPQVVWASGPTHSDVVAASLISFSAGIAMGAWINNSHPWGWGGWGWGWGGRGIVVQNNVWVVNNRWRSPNPSFRPRPPRFNRPIYARPPSNWNQRPGRRPPPP